MENRFELHLGKSQDVLKEYQDNHFDSVVCDPPYHLTSIVKRFGKWNSAPCKFGNDGAYARASRGFMGKEWDGGDIAFDPAFWSEVLRVLKPGGHLLAFSGSRTYHRMAVGIEDAGFEIRDQIQWIFGSGFPKSHNLDGDWQGWGSALKPAHEPICVARKPLVGTIAENVLEWGTGALNIDGCRVGNEERFNPPTRKSRSVALGSFENCNGEGTTALGRWPANVIHDGSDEVTAGFLQDMGESAARFFYCAKASKEDRDEGLDGFEIKLGGTLNGRSGINEKSQLDGPTPARANTHPTVKPTDLMRYLCRLVTPPDGLILDPFMGSGSTGKAAMLEGFRFVGVDMTPEYLEIASARIQHAHDQRHDIVALVNREALHSDQMSLFEK